MRKRPKRSKTSAMREEFNRQMKEKEAGLPWDISAFYVERYHTDKYGDQVRIAGHIETYTAHTPEEVRTFGNKMKLLAANNELFNVMVRVDNRDDLPPRVYPRKPPSHVKTREDLEMTTAHRWRDKVQHDIKQAQDATRGVGDFDKKPDEATTIEMLLDDGEPELEDNNEI